MQYTFRGLPGHVLAWLHVFVCLYISWQVHPWLPCATVNVTQLYNTRSMAYQSTCWPGYTFSSVYKSQGGRTPDPRGRGRDWSMCARRMWFPPHMWRHTGTRLTRSSSDHQLGEKMLCRNMHVMSKCMRCMWLTLSTLKILWKIDTSWILISNNVRNSYMYSNCIILW